MPPRAGHGFKKFTSRGFGTSVRRTPDLKRFAEALKTSGIDPRHWCSYGTVCVVDDAGKRDNADPEAVLVGPSGVEVDVVLEPMNLPVTCHYAGIQGGCSTTFFSPIRPGDRVLVVLPEGNPNYPPVITSILHSTSCPVPLGADKKPIFKNDRVLLWAEDTDVDVRTKGGAHVEVKQDGTVLLNNGTRGVARLDDTTSLTMSGIDVASLATKLIATGAFVTTGLGPFPASSITFTDGKITSASATVKSG